jgi:hypothetical protein
LSAAALSLLLLLVAASLGQTASAQHLISSKAGFVNRVEGKVYIQRQDSAEDEKGRASLGTQMRNGDRISTAVNSYAEVLLNPGAYLRLDQQSEVRAVNTSLSEVRFELLKGAVIAEVGEADKKMPLEIITPQGSVAIAKEGLYRIDARAGATIIKVRKGELVLGTRAQLVAGGGTKVGRNKVVELTGSSAFKPEIAKLDSFDLDEFDEWSFQRAEMLVAANYSVLRRAQYTPALSFGWMYDPFYNCYTFIPGSRRLYSPYGFSFYNSFSHCSCYLPYYYPYYGSGPYYGGGGTTAGGSTLRPSTTPRIAPGGNNARTPIHREIGPGRQIDSGAGASRGANFGSNRTVDMGGSRSGSMGGGMSGSSGGGRSVDMGGGASRGSVGGASSSPPPPPPPPPAAAPSRSASGGAGRIIQ